MKELINKYGWIFTLCLGMLLFIAIITTIVTQPLPFKSETIVVDNSQITNTVLNQTIVQVQEPICPEATNWVKLSYENGEATIHCKI